MPLTLRVGVSESLSHLRPRLKGFGFDTDFADWDVPPSVRDWMVEFRVEVSDVKDRFDIDELRSKRCHFVLDTTRCAPDGKWQSLVCLVTRNRPTKIDRIAAIYVPGNTCSRNGFRIGKSIVSWERKRKVSLEDFVKGMEAIFAQMDHKAFVRWYETAEMSWCGFQG